MKKTPINKSSQKGKWLSRKSTRTFFRKNLLRGVGVEEDLSFVIIISFGVSLVTITVAVAGCGAGASGALVFCFAAGLSCGGATFASDATVAVITGCSAIWKHTQEFVNRQRAI